MVIIALSASNSTSLLMHIAATTVRFSTTVHGFMTAIFVAIVLTVTIFSDVPISSKNNIAFLTSNIQKKNTKNRL
ncbi:hypothetical protein A2971_01985 [Candidatus Gottesmanbacteria bacterium RIFCSPLOWO2_01_FULL_46_21]|uniref:Uncharacterized protein n=1 Tax=Candidatus Gottesmanbacteria bacterium RIFCSPLOWO2_01_FULL_46_21 TaxID=1798393 RepID=A0A1F6B071_9BACT|nr:MAG: hypothetical protein A2971_01985 [Candidatus Gottesmanbacteria bacterium RIFCSPLOWO2_01_FULL_46_21]